MKKLNIKRFATADPSIFEMYTRHTENYDTFRNCISVTVSTVASLDIIQITKNGIDVSNEWSGIPGPNATKTYTSNTTETLTFYGSNGQEYVETIDITSVETNPVIPSEFYASDTNIKINPDIKIGNQNFSFSELVLKILEVEDFMNNYGLVAKGNASNWSTGTNWSMGAISTSQILKENVIKFNSSENAFEFLQSGEYQIIVSGRFDDTASTSVNTGVGIAIKTSSGTSYNNTVDSSLYNSWQDNNHRLTGYFNRVVSIESGTKIKPKAFSQGNSNFKECIIQIIRLK